MDECISLFARFPFHLSIQPLFHSFLPEIFVLRCYHIQHLLDVKASTVQGEHGAGTQWRLESRWGIPKRTFQKSVAACLVVSTIEGHYRLFVDSGQEYKCPALGTIVLCNNKMGIHPSCPLTVLLEFRYVKNLFIK